jgi:DNA-binding response OmpR family regulator
LFRRGQVRTAYDSNPSVIAAAPAAMQLGEYDINMAGSRQIIIATLDRSLRSDASNAVATQGIQPLLEVWNPQKTVQRVLCSEISAIILDVDTVAQDQSYYDILRRLGERVPIILMGEKGDLCEVVHSLDAGAIDYMTKPIRPAALLARLRAHLRSYQHSPHTAIFIGDNALYPSVGVLHDRSCDRRIHLAPKECALLRTLAAAKGRPVAKHALLSGIWGYRRAVDTFTLDTHIHRIRKKVRESRSSTCSIVYEDGGYSLKY